MESQRAKNNDLSRVAFGVLAYEDRPLFSPPERVGESWLTERLARCWVAGQCCAGNGGVARLYSSQ